MNPEQQRSSLRIPPFPGAQSTSLAIARTNSEYLSDSTVDRLLDLLRNLKVGGDYWARQPELPDCPYTLVRVSDPFKRSQVLQGLLQDEAVVYWAGPSGDGGPYAVSGPCDPWHMIGGAKQVIVDSDDELAFIAALADVPLTLIGGGTTDPRAHFRTRIGMFSYRDPFTGEPISLEAAIALCGFWRQLVDSNRGIGTAVGFAFWKRPTVAPLLWGGSDVNFASKSIEGRKGKVAVWKARTPASVLADLERSQAELIEIEDGFIRSAGLGANCVPPLSIVVDRLGVHFDPSRPSELEQMIANGAFSHEIVERARLLRDLIVASGISKYGAGSAAPLTRVNQRRHILVPGQVEDDRAVLCGGGAIGGNLDLLRRVRLDAPDAYILYKPHPDVEAGHRIGGLADDQCFEFADEIVRNQPISALIEFVDEVHVNSSLAGFEALLRLKPVTTHGVPFYAGWGLTRDLGPVPERRRASRTIDELVAAVLLLYPRYLDPLTGLPCPPEVLVRRIAESGATPREGLVVQMRRFQGRLKKRLASLKAAR